MFSPFVCRVCNILVPFICWNGKRFMMMIILDHTRVGNAIIEYERNVGHMILCEQMNQSDETCRFIYTSIVWLDSWNDICVSSVWVSKDDIRVSIIIR